MKARLKRELLYMAFCVVAGLLVVPTLYAIVGLITGTALEEVLRFMSNFYGSPFGLVGEYHFPRVWIGIMAFYGLIRVIRLTTGAIHLLTRKSGSRRTDAWTQEGKI